MNLCCCHLGTATGTNVSFRNSAQADEANAHLRLPWIASFSEMIGFGQNITPVNVTLDAELKGKCPKAALGCISAQVESPASPEALIGELQRCEQAILKLP